MADTILSGDFTIYYEAENRRKQIKWTGSATGTRTVNELYSALQDQFDELTQLDDGTPMSAQTPTEYTIGIIDTGDDDPWFIDRVTVQHLTGGALRTASWARATSTNTGVVKVVRTTSTNIVAGDIGFTITHAGGDTGTLLDIVGDVLWIRPATSGAGNDWDSTSGNITCNAHTDVQASAATSGESLWANVFSLGTIEPYTHMYIEQNGALLTKYDDAAVDWWSDGQIDILVNVKEVGVETDEGFIKVFARQHTKTYAFFEVDLASGGRNPIPLQTGDDLDNEEGYFQMVLTTASGGTFAVGNVIRDDSNADIDGVITSVSGTGANQTLQYYVIGDPQTNFGAGTGAFTEYDSANASTGVTATAVAPTSVNSAASPATDVTVTHGASTAYDVDENDTTENYSIVIDCSNEPLTTVQARLKYITRRGETGTTSTDGQQGQFYLGSDYRLRYSGSITGTLNEGEIVTQAGTLAEGTVVSKNTTAKIIILRSSRGTFNTSGLVTEATNGGTFTPNTSAVAITPIAASPFGTFAGGKFFGAPGVVLINVPTADATNYQLIDDTGTVVVPPNKVSVSVANTRAEDTVAVFRLSTQGGNINKTEYAATVQSQAAATVVAGSSIAADVPGKTTGGVLRIVDVSASTEYRLRFSSWSSATFTLSQTAERTTTSGTTTTSLIDSGAAFLTTARVGDLVFLTSDLTYTYITAVVSDTEITVATLTGLGVGDTYRLNVLPVATTTSDYIYIPIIDTSESTGTDVSSGTESATITFSTDIYVRVIARNSHDTASTTTPMLPYAADATITSNGLSNNIIRSLDTIKT